MNSRVQLTHLVCFRQQHIRIPGDGNDDDDADDDVGDENVGDDDDGDDNVGDDDDGDDDLCARCSRIKMVDALDLLLIT